MRRLMLAGAVVACAKPAAPARPIEPALFTIRADACGPLTAQTPATLASLRAAFAGYDVTPINSATLEYRVSLGGAKMLDVVPDESGNILNVHVATPKVDVAGKPWRVGAKFSGDISTCECWADQTVCFRDGEHVGAVIAKVCREGAGRAAVIGLPIRGLVWSVRPLLAGGYEPPRTDDEPE